MVGLVIAAAGVEATGGAPSKGGAGVVAEAALGSGGNWSVVELLPLFDCEAKYGTPIEAPIKEAMMSGLDAMLLPNFITDI